MNYFLNLPFDLQEYIFFHKISMVIQRSWRRHRDCFFDKILLEDLMYLLYDEYYLDRNENRWLHKYDLP